MPAIITEKNTQHYSTEFKVKAVEWCHQAHRSVQSVSGHRAAAGGGKRIPVDSSRLQQRPVE